MSDDRKEGVKLSLTVTLNKEGNKVLYAVADSHFVDVLLSFLTLPLGRIVKVLEKHFGEEAPAIGSLNSLYHSLANLDSSHFWTEGAKNTLLNPTSPIEAEYEKLKIDISDSPPPEYFSCSKCTFNKFRSVSMYYDCIKNCYNCKGAMSKGVVEKSSEAPASSAEVFVKHTSSFIISDNLHILPSETRFLRVISVLGINETGGKSIKVDLGFDEIMKLLKASLTSPTPLSDVILNKTTPTNLPILKYLPKLLFAQARKGFIEFLLGLFCIPLGEVENLIGGDTLDCFKAIDNLYRSTSLLIDDGCLRSHYFGSQSTKSRLVKPNVVHGCVSENFVLPLTQEPLPASYINGYDHQVLASSVKFPKGQGNSLRESLTYKVMDDLTVEPYCFASILSSLREQKVLLSDVKEVEVKIGSKEPLSILKASLTSTHALSHALFNHISTKQPKTEV